MQRPWFPLYVADYLADNTELSIVEHGVFCLLLMHCWRLNGQLPNDLKQLYRMCGATNQHEKKAVEKVVGMRFLTSENQMWLTSKRLCEELDKCLKISEKRSASAVQMHSKSSAKKMQLHTQSQSQKESILSGSEKKPDPIPYEEIMDLFNSALGTSYKASTKINREVISARWKDGYRIPDFQKVISNKKAEWQSDPKMSKYLRPQTLFNGNFESYLNQKVVNQQLSLQERHGDNYGY